MSFMDKKKQVRLASRDFAVKAENARLHAQFHLYSVVAARFRGFEGWELGKVAARPTVIYDLSGLPLFYDFPVRKGRKQAGFIRTPANKVLGDSVVSTQVTPLGWDMKVAWNELHKLMKKKYPGYATRRMRMVCYSYPKLALSAELVASRRETKTLLMDVGDFTEIPPMPVVEIDHSGQFPYSLLNKIPEEQEKGGQKIWDKVNQELEGLFRKEKRLEPERMYKLRLVDRLEVIDRVIIKPQLIKLYTERILDFCSHTGGCRDHECFCLHPQENNVHCTRASSQMVLCYWRYSYSQHEIAQAFGVNDNQGTPWGSVAPGLNSLTSNCFDATLNYSVNWSACVDEIENRRPFLSDNGGHTRACAGTKQWNIRIIGQPQPRWLYIFDPWPPNTGAIYWENFNTANYAWICTLIRKTTNHA